MELKYEYVESQEELRKQIQKCEGRHTQLSVIFMGELLGTC